MAYPDSCACFEIDLQIARKVVGVVSVQKVQKSLKTLEKEFVFHLTYGEV